MNVFVICIAALILVASPASSLTIGASSSVAVESGVITDGAVVVQSDLNLESESNSSVEAVLSNGALIKINTPPSEAKATAQAAMGTSCDNCSISLIETKSEGTTTAAYRVEDSYEARLLFVIPTTVRIVADVDADTGEVIRINRPLKAYISSRVSA